MRRHEIPFPMQEKLYRILPKMWEDGWLDDFAEEHFLIRAIYKDDSIKNRLLKYYECCTEEFAISHVEFATTFCMNFSAKMTLLIDVFGESAIKGFVRSQLSAGKKHYKESQFFEALSEIEILTYFCQFGPGWTKGEYEPRIGIGNHNPEASFIYPEGTNLHIYHKSKIFLCHCIV